MYLLWQKPHASYSSPAKEATCHTCKKEGIIVPNTLRKDLLQIAINFTALNEQSQEYYNNLFLDTINTEQKCVVIQVE